MVEGDEAAPIRSIAMKEKHFKNPPMFTFTSDSPNIAMKLHRLAGESNEFLLVMGCTPHALHKYTEDLIKEFPGPKRILKQLVSMVIGVRKVHLILALFDNLCVQKYGRTLVLFLYTKSRQGTVYWSAQRALRVRTALMVLPGEIAAKDLTIAIPNGLMNLLLDGAFWKGVAALEMVFKPIVSCLTSLEGDEATFSSVYACCLAILFHIHSLKDSVKYGFLGNCLNGATIENMKNHLRHRFNTMYSPAHALAFRTDSFCDAMREQSTETLGGDAVGFGQGTILQQCKNALYRIAGNNLDLR
jgi:hypothetical protein